MAHPLPLSLNLAYPMPPGLRPVLVGDTGIEPVTSSV